MSRRVASIILCICILVSLSSCIKKRGEEANIPSIPAVSSSRDFPSTDIKNTWYGELKIGDAIPRNQDEAFLIGFPEEQYVTIDRQVYIYKDDGFYILLILGSSIINSSKDMCELLGVIVFNEERQIIYSMGKQAQLVEEDDIQEYFGKKYSDDIINKLGQPHTFFTGGSEKWAHVTTNGYIIVFYAGAEDEIWQILYYDIIDRTWEIITEKTNVFYAWDDENKGFVIKDKEKWTKGK